MRLTYTNAGFEADKLQEALDSAALRAVRLYGEGQTEAEATQMANETFFGNWDPSQRNGDPPAVVLPPSLNILYSEVGQQITAAADYSFDYQPVFLTRLSFPISRHSSASYQTGGEACILALNRTADRAFEVSGSSRVDTSGCTITANSSSDEAIYVGGSGTLKTECLYTPGKVSASPSSTTLACGQPREGSAVAIDPFKRKNNADCRTSGGSVRMRTELCRRRRRWRHVQWYGQDTKQTSRRICRDAEAGDVRRSGNQGQCEAGARQLHYRRRHIEVRQPVGPHRRSGHLLPAERCCNRHPWRLDLQRHRPDIGRMGRVLDCRRPSNTAPAVINGNSNSHLNGIIYMPAAQEVQYAGNGGTGGECVRIIAQEITMIGNSTFKLDCKSELANNEINNPGAIRLVE